MSGGDRIDGYLDELFARLRGDPAECRSMLAEAEAHLRDAAAASVAVGMDEDAAQQAAIAAFGSPGQVAQAAGRRSMGATVVAFVAAGGGLALTGFVAIGLSVAAARVLALITSTSWVYGAPASYTFTAAQCAHWLAVQPTATTCGAAAAMENSDDSSLFSLTGVIAGLILVGLVLAAVALVRRHSATPRRRVPRLVVWAVGATAFGGAGVALIAAGIGGAVVRGHWGQGLWYVEGVVALLFGIYFAIRLIAATSRSLTATVDR